MRGLENRAKLGSRWLGCKVSKARGLGQQLCGRIRKITYHVSGRYEKGRALQSLASYRARGRSQSPHFRSGGRAAGGAFLASRVLSGCRICCFLFLWGELSVIALFRRLRGPRAFSVLSSVRSGSEAERWRGRRGLGRCSARSCGPGGPGGFPGATAQEFARDTVFLCCSPTAAC